MSNRDARRHAQTIPQSAAFPRRQAVQVGVVGALGLTLGDFFRRRSQAAEPTSATSGPKSPLKEGPAKSVIQINLVGGAAQQETWDPKPEAPGEYRGPFGVVKTKLTGELFSDNLKACAGIADELCVIRSVVGKIPDHALATYHLYTGYTPSTVIDYPQMGAVVSQQFGPRKNLPPYVAIPENNSQSGSAGYLSTKYGAFELGSDPGQPNFKVRDFTPPSDVSPEQFARRQATRKLVEARLRGKGVDPQQLETMDEFYERAYNLIRSPEAQKAFTLDDESTATIERYGDARSLKNRNPLGIGKRLILARRLVEAGVRFVTVSYGAFDSHVRIKDDCLEYLPAFDQAFAALIGDLKERGLLDSTLVVVTTEFGRTPKTNATDGRDHWARVYSMAMAGGGTARGRIYGASDPTAAEPSRDATPLEDVLYTIYRQLGVDADQRLMAPGDRPIDVIRGGKLVPGLLG